MGTTTATIRKHGHVLIPPADDVALALAETPIWDEALADHIDQLAEAGVTAWASQTSESDVSV